VLLVKQKPAPTFKGITIDVDVIPDGPQLVLFS